MSLGELPPWLLRGFAVVMGLLWGSFLNVVIYRVPRGMSVVHPPSHCPACGAPIRPWLNVPVFAWLALRGRAACCKAKVPFRYPAVEALGGLLALAVMEACVLSLGPDVALERAGAIFAVDLALALALLAATFIDLEHMILPDSITLGGAAVGLATFSLRDGSFVGSLVGGAVGFGIVWVPFILLYGLAKGGRAGMGLGDAKLLLLAGTWFGWAGALFVLAAGAVQGTLVAIPLLLSGKGIPEPEAVKKEREEFLAELATLPPEERAEIEKEYAGDPALEGPGEGWRQVRLPFGPFLALALLEHLLLGRDTPARLFGWMEALLG